MKFTYGGDQEQSFGLELVDGSGFTAVPGQTYDLLVNPENALFTAAAESVTAIATGLDAFYATAQGQRAAATREVAEGTVVGAHAEAPDAPQTPAGTEGDQNTDSGAETPKE